MKFVDLSKLSDFGSAFLKEMCEKLEVSYASYGTIDPITGDTLGYSTASEDWRNLYVEKNFLRTDPIISSAKSLRRVTDWSEFKDLDGYHKIRSLGHDHGVPTSGLILPVRGVNGEVVFMNISADMTQSQWDEHKQKILGELHLATVTLHDAVTKTPEIAQYSIGSALTNREIEVLQWVAAGKTQQDIGDILGLAARTIETHIKSARLKLRALTTPQAIGRAIAKGLISPS